jgi:hypothetical protein
MYIYPDGSFHADLPPVVTQDGIKRGGEHLAPAEWDKLGYNKVEMLKREPFTTYRTQYVKGDDFVYRERVVSKVAKEESLLTGGYDA